MLIPTYTEEFRLNELAKGERSLFYFGVSILGFDSYDKRLKRSTLKPFHQDLCHFLEGRHPHRPWNRAVVAAFRGAGKSMWTSKAYPWWRALYVDNWSCKLIGNSSDSIKVNQFAPMIDLFTSSRRSDYLGWLFQHRIPTGFAGWTGEQVKLNQTDAMAMPALSYWGLSSKFEGYHGNCIIIDDPEGADADKSHVGNVDSYNVWEKAHPLLISINDDQILLVATPHGDRPVTYKLRDQEKWNSVEDNERTAIKFFWLPIEDESGHSRWPEKISDVAMQQLRKLQNAAQQYWLRRRAEASTVFDLQEIQAAAYRFLGGAETKIISYDGYTYDPNKLTDEGFVVPVKKQSLIELKKLRFFVHFDPIHKTTAAKRTPANQLRPAQAAIVVVGVGPDLHAFTVDHWVKDGAELHEQAEQLMKFYRKYQPHIVTYESVGAQFWLESFIKTQEKQRPDWARPLSLPYLTNVSVPLPQLSSRLREAAKTNESKEDLYRESLSPHLNLGTLHIRADQHEILYQLEHVLNEDVAVDLIDCLAQGPGVWKAPRYDVLARDFMARRQFVENMVGRTVGNLAGGRKWGKRS